MDFIPADLQAYCDAHTNGESPLLAKLNRHTHANVMLPRMLSGHFQGRLLSMFSKLQQPKYILEIGTYVGYSAICLAEGLQEGGKLVTLDINVELEDLMRESWAEAGMAEKIELHLGKAAEIIPTLPYQWDMVFIDADKANYGLYYDLVFPQVKIGGTIIADNVLWSGKVSHPEDFPKDKDLSNMLAFNKKLHEDPRTENILLPVRDGLMVVRKLKD